jgi:2-iminobutanoate/2-iminopropanoate deaminase
MKENFKATKVITEKSPTHGPYSAAVKFGNLVFCSGQIGTDSLSNNLVEGGATEEIKQVIKNLEAVLLAAGSGLDKVLQTTIYIKDMTKYADVNAIYAQYFKTEPRPARATVEVSNLPKGANIEISCIAYI